MQVLSGRLNRRITLLAPTAITDTLGSPETIYNEAGTRWAGQLHFNPRDVEGDAQRKPVSMRRYLLRLDTLTRGINTKWRISDHGTLMQVLGVDPEYSHGSLVLTVEAMEN